MRELSISLENAPAGNFPRPRHEFGNVYRSTLHAKTESPAGSEGDSMTDVHEDSPTPQNFGTMSKVDAESGPRRQKRVLKANQPSNKRRQSDNAIRSTETDAPGKSVAANTARHRRKGLEQEESCQVVLFWLGL